MDPKAAIEALVEALEYSDREAAQEHAANLQRWLNQGGYAPKIEAHTLAFLIGTIADLLQR